MVQLYQDRFLVLIFLKNESQPPISCTQPPTSCTQPPTHAHIITFSQTHSQNYTHYFPVEIVKLGRTVTQLITTLSMIEVCLPVSTLVPSLHCTPLLITVTRQQKYVMWSFEQFNQHFKSQWVRNKNHPMTSAGIFLSFCHARHPTSLFASNFTHSHVNVTRSFTVDGAASYLIGKKTTIQTRVILEPWDHAGQYQSRSRFSSVTSRHQSTPLHAYITLAVCPVFIPSQREMYG